MKIQFGLKAWSTNMLLIPETIKAFEERSLDYVELFCVPGTVMDTAPQWSATGIPFIVHAPHSLSGLNFSQKGMAAQNRELAEEAFKMADILAADTVIFHPGTDGNLEETISQVQKNYDPRMVIENKPYSGLDGSICIGSTPEEISSISKVLNIPFCLDFGHAVASANSHKIDPLEFIKQFILLSPKMYHLTDGEYSSELDHHKMYGTGDFPMREFLKLIPDNSKVSNEAERSDNNSIRDYLIDREWVESNA